MISNLLIRIWKAYFAEVQVIYLGKGRDFSGAG